MHIPDPEDADPVLGALTLLDAIREQHPGKLTWTEPRPGSYTIDKILGTDEYRRGREDAGAFLAKYQEKREAFRKEREAFLLYE